MPDRGCGRHAAVQCIPVSDTTRFAVSARSPVQPAPKRRRSARGGVAHAACRIVRRKGDGRQFRIQRVVPPGMPSSRCSFIASVGGGRGRQRRFSHRSSRGAVHPARWRRLPPTSPRSLVALLDRTLVRLNENVPGDTLLSALNGDATVSAKALVGTGLVNNTAALHGSLPVGTAALGRALLGAVLLAHGKEENERVQIEFRCVGRGGRRHFALFGVLGADAVGARARRVSQRGRSGRSRRLSGANVARRQRGHHAARGEERAATECARLTDAAGARRFTPQAMLEQLLEGMDMHMVGESKPCYACTCSRSKVERLLTLLPHDEVMSVLREQQQFEGTCEFCGATYRISANEAAAIANRARNAGDAEGDESRSE
eukprot:ctg_93.g24